MQHNVSLPSLYPSYHRFPSSLVHSVNHPSHLTLKHVLVDALTTYLITVSSTCFTVKWIIDHGYLLYSNFMRSKPVKCQW